MLRLYLLTGTAWTKHIDVDCDERGDILGAIDEFYYEKGKDAFPVCLYDPSDLDEEQLETYVPINGGEYYIEGISHAEVI